MPKRAPNVRQEIVAVVERALGETLALQAICATLMAEIARLDTSPQDRLGNLVASIQGMVHSVAVLAETRGQAQTKEMMRVVTQVVDQICSMAEASLQASGEPPKGQ